ncbi:MAG: hypothetical protein J6N52_04345 [Clostridia bacterium]|nr:hypothetical protein [Clostridia bacterium]
MRVKRITSIDTALRIYYMFTEIGNKEIRELFGIKAQDCLVRYKEEVRKQQAAEGVLTNCAHTVNTRIAYKVWGIDVEDLEKRRSKLKKLGLMS